MSPSCKKARKAHGQEAPGEKDPRGTAVGGLCGQGPPSSPPGLDLPMSAAGGVGPKEPNAPSGCREPGPAVSVNLPL